MTRGRWVLLALAGLTLMSGCRAMGQYFRARGRDLADCGRARLAFGLGLYAEAELTSLVQPSVGFLDATLSPRYSLQWDPRSVKSFGEVRTAAFPTLLLVWPYYGYTETQAGYGDTRPYLRAALAPWILMGNHQVARTSNSLFRLHNLIPNPRLVAEKDQAPPPGRLTDSFWLAVSGTALLLNTDLGVNPLEMLDLVAGIFGFDPLQDDMRSETPVGE